MSRAAVELDFFGLEKDKSSAASSSSSSISKSLDRRRSFRGIQSAISKINPELLKSVISSTAFSAPPTPKMEQNVLPPLPLYVPVPRPTNVAETDSKEMSPLTIFYNGTVTVFDISSDKAENIMKFALEASSKAAEQESKTAPAAPSSDQKQQLLGDLPLFRRKSLQSFLAKRKERLTSLSPYACDDDHNNNYGRGSGKKPTTVGNRIGI